MCIHVCTSIALHVWPPCCGSFSRISDVTPQVLLGSVKFHALDEAQASEFSGYKKNSLIGPIAPQPLHHSTSCMTMPKCCSFKVIRNVPLHVMIAFAVKARALRRRPFPISVILHRSTINKTTPRFCRADSLKGGNFGEGTCKHQ